VDKQELQLGEHLPDGEPRLCPMVDYRTPTTAPATGAPYFKRVARRRQWWDGLTDGAQDDVAFGVNLLREYARHVREIGEE
jgi:hypothetical protein